MSSSIRAAGGSLRIDTLRKTGLLDTAPEPSFDRLTRLATRFLNAPVALVSLVDEDRQFFKSQCGLPEPWASRRETPLAQSFCQHVVAREDALIVENAREHPLVMDNPAIPDLGVAAYAGVPLRAGDGQVLGSFCVFDWEPRAWTVEEIEVLSELAAAVETEIRLRTEMAERQTRDQQFRLLVEHSPDVIARFDLDLRHTYVSPVIQRSGLSPDMFLGRTHAEVAAEFGIPEPFASRWTEAMERVRDTCREERFEFSLPHPDGVQHWESRISPLLATNGEVKGLLAVGRDMTQIWQAERALRESEERFRQVGAAVPQVIWVFTPDFSETLYLSPAYETIWGLPLETGYSEPQSFLACIHPEDRASMLESMAQVAQGPMQTPEYRISRPDGSERWLRGSGSPVRDAAGRVLRVVGITEDITERKQLEARLLHSQKMEAVGQLAGGVAHDFNNMLTAIGGFAAFLEGEVEEGSDAEEYVHEIQKAASRASDLTRQLLAFGRRQVLQAEVLDINTLVRDSEKMLRRLVPSSIGIELQLEPGAGTVRFDPTQMHQVLLNLVVNARDAMPNGGQLWIRTARRAISQQQADGTLPPGEYVTLVVQDTGEGMDEETLSRAFEPFFTRKPVGQGTGLGLATVEGIVSQSGGHIRVESRIGVGSTFSVWLPGMAGAGSAAAAGNRGSAVSVDGGATVLLVEDEEVVRKLARRILTRVGYSVVEASDGEEALRVFEAHGGGIDLLLTDAVMPKMGGRALALALRERRLDLPIILMSGYAEDMAHGDGRLPDGVTFVQKPFDPPALARAVAAAIQGGRPLTAEGDLAR